MIWPNLLFLIAFSCTAFPLLGWDPPPQIALKGVLKTAAQKSTARHPDNTEEHHEKSSTVLVLEEPITFARSITIGAKPALVQQETAEFVHLFMCEEFDSLLGKEVELRGHFVEPSTRFYFISDIQFDVDAAIDIKQQKEHPAPTVFYEPSITELKGMLYQKTYPGPPEYYSVEHGDIPESPLFLILTEPVDVLLAEPEAEPFNQPEVGVREIQIIFSKDDPPEDLWSKGVNVRGSLFSAHTGHHRRRVLMMANSWEPTLIAVSTS
jgi:hypothetical protein